MLIKTELFQYKLTDEYFSKSEWVVTLSFYSTKQHSGEQTPKKHNWTGNFMENHS